MTYAYALLAYVLIGIVWATIRYHWTLRQARKPNQKPTYDWLVILLRH